MLNAARVIGESHKLVAITIPDVDSAPTTVWGSGMSTGLSTMQKRQVVTWMINDDCSGAYRWSHNSGMSSPNKQITAYTAWEPKVGRIGAEKTYIRGSTGKATQTCTATVWFGGTDR